MSKKLEETLYKSLNEKKELRRKFKDERARLSRRGDVGVLSQSISQHLATWLAANLATGKRVFAFIALAGEPDLSPLFCNPAINERFQFAFPVISTGCTTGGRRRSGESGKSTGVSTGKSTGNDEAEFQMEFYSLPRSVLLQLDAVSGETSAGAPEKSRDPAQDPWERSGFLEKNTFGGWQPIAHPQCKVWPTKGDVMLLPSLAVDYLGTRLGFGKGYYDRYLARLTSPPRLIAPNFSSCFTEHPLPRSVWDKAVDAVVTEKGWRDLTPA